MSENCEGVTYWKFYAAGKYISCFAFLFRHTSSILCLSVFLQALPASAFALGLFGLKDNSK